SSDLGVADHEGGAEGDDVEGGAGPGADGADPGEQPQDQMPPADDAGPAQEDGGGAGPDGVPGAAQGAGDDDGDGVEELEDRRGDHDLRADGDEPGPDLRRRVGVDEDGDRLLAEDEKGDGAQPHVGEGELHAQHRAAVGE